MTETMINCKTFNINVAMHKSLDSMLFLTDKTASLIFSFVCRRHKLIWFNHFFFEVCKLRSFHLSLDDLRRWLHIKILERFSFFSSCFQHDSISIAEAHMKSWFISKLQSSKSLSIFCHCWEIEKRSNDKTHWQDEKIIRKIMLKDRQFRETKETEYQSIRNRRVIKKREC